MHWTLFVKFSSKNRSVHKRYCEQTSVVKKKKKEKLHLSRRIGAFNVKTVMKFEGREEGIVGISWTRWSPYDKYYPPSRRVGNERSYLTALRVICIFQPEASGRSLLSAIWNARGWRPRFDLHFGIETVPLPFTLRWLTRH